MRPLILAAVLVLGVTPHTHAQRESTLPPPPLAEPVAIAVHRGKEVEISLRASGRTPSPLKFLIRSQPRHGTLGEIQSSGPRSASVVYRQDPDSSATHDRFRFAVQAVDSPVSAPAEVTISILESPAQITAPESVDFGTTGVGKIATTKIPLRNTGGSPGIARVSVDPPWTIEGPAERLIPPGGEFPVIVAFSPNSARRFEGTLRLSGFPDVFTRLQGEGRHLLSVTPSGEIFLPAENGREAMFSVKNHSEAPQLVRIEVPQGLQIPDPVEIPPGESSKIVLKVRPDWNAGIDGEAVLSSSGLELRVPVRAEPEPARLESGDSLDFGILVEGARIEKTFAIRNVGGQPADLAVSAPPEIVVFPEPSRVVIPPGESQTFTAALYGNQHMQSPGKLIFTTGNAASLEIPWRVRARDTPAEIPLPTLPTFPAAGIAAQSWKPSGQSAEEGSETLWVPEGGFEFLSAVPGRVRLAWKTPIPPPARYSLEWRSLVFAGDDLPPSVKWNPMPSCRFSESEGRVTAEIMRLPPDSAWIVRFVLWNDAGTQTGHSEALRIVSPPLPPPPFGGLIAVVLGIGVIAALAIFLIRRAHRSSVEEDRLRIRRLESPD